MRTTLTLENDVAVRLEKLKKEKRLSLKNLVNQALRAGLDQVEKPAGDEHPIRISGVRLGRKLPNLDNIAEVLAVAEAESWK